MVFPYSRGRHGKFAFTVIGPSHVPILTRPLEVFFYSLASSVKFISFQHMYAVHSPFLTVVPSCLAVLATRIQPRISPGMSPCLPAVLQRARLSFD